MQKIKFTIYRFFLICAFSLFLVSPAKADMSEVLCESYINAISSTAYMLRSGGYPIGEATNQIHDLGIEDSNMRIFLKKLVNSIYRDPEATMKMVENKDALKICIKDARGY